MGIRSIFLYTFLHTFFVSLNNRPIDCSSTEQNCTINCNADYSCGVDIDILNFSGPAINCPTMISCIECNIYCNSNQACSGAVINGYNCDILNIEVNERDNKKMTVYAPNDGSLYVYVPGNGRIKESQIYASTNTDDIIIECSGSEFKSNIVNATNINGILSFEGSESCISSLSNFFCPKYNNCTIICDGGYCKAMEMEADLGTHTLDFFCGSDVICTATKLSCDYASDTDCSMSGCSGPCVYPPTYAPTIATTKQPSYNPSFIPTLIPTHIPSFISTGNPSIAPTADPTLMTDNSSLLTNQSITTEYDEYSHDKQVLLILAGGLAFITLYICCASAIFCGYMYCKARKIKSTMDAMENISNINGHELQTMEGQVHDGQNKIRKSFTVEEIKADDDMQFKSYVDQRRRRNRKRLQNRNKKLFGKKPSIQLSNNIYSKSGEIGSGINQEMLQNHQILDDSNTMANMYGDIIPPQISPLPKFMQIYSNTGTEISRNGCYRVTINTPNDNYREKTANLSV